VFFDKRVPNNHDRSQRFSLLLDDGSKSLGTHTPMPGLELTQNSLSGIPTSLTTPRNTFQQDQDTNTQDDMSSHSSAEELSKENDNLKDEIIKLMALDDSDFGEAPRSGDRKKRGNEKVRRACSKIIKKRLWPNTKFVTSERQLNVLANKVWDELPKDLWGYTEQDKEPFMRMYRDFMGTVINGQRTIVTGDLKKKPSLGWTITLTRTRKRTKRQQFCRLLSKLHAARSATLTMGCTKFSTGTLTVCCHPLSGISTTFAKVSVSLPIVRR
jgi:hypothetical protein